ncbi:hypothetical protein BsIDN1_62780 [Bacillus safensis]|uniref:Uncharacterized protein n=1 Tax=Bacillus safensis TaxID=561879 RepID=A0A5S9MGP3_BACIA|nr:hypothetical protein BsIDN1_62780 [Bacillus safensis]
MEDITGTQIRQKLSMPQKKKVLKYNNQLISATYYSSNGGYTEASEEEVWGNALPYLVAKKDPKDPVNPWTLKLSKKQLGTTLTASTAASEWSKAKETNAADLAGLKSWLLKNKETAASDMKIASISSLTFSGENKRPACEDGIDQTDIPSEKQNRHIFGKQKHNGKYEDDRVSISHGRNKGEKHVCVSQKKYK